MTITIGLLIRVSTSVQVGNYRSEKQYDLGPRIEERGCAVRYYDEQGTSGADLSKRKVTMAMLDDLKSGVIQGIGAFDCKRLTRDEFGIDGGTIARLIVAAGGRFHTWDREYNLRLDDDLLQFQFQCFIAGIDWRNIRNTLWSGIFKKMESEPHYQKTPLGYMNVADDKGRMHLAKNPAHAEAIEALERLFDQCDSLSEVIRRLNAEGPQRPSFRGRGGDSTRWHKYGVRYVLRNEIYTGKYTFGVGLKERSTVWDKFATDRETGKPKDFLQYRPDLAYWDAVRVRRWRRKFDKPELARFVKGRPPRVLAAVLECISCGSRMIAHGPGNYACSALGAGKGRGGKPCAAPQIIGENAVLQILRYEMTRAMGDAQALAAAARASLLERKPSEAAQRLAFLEERVKTVTEAMFGDDDEQLGPVATAALRARLRKAEDEMATLREQVADEEDARLGDEQIADTCEILLNSPLEALDALSPDKQARVYALLFSGVQVEIRGAGTGRRWRLRQYVARLSGELQVIDDAPWAHLPNPSQQSAAPRTLIFEAIDSDHGRTVVTDISARRYVDYLGSLRELAGALAGAV